MSFSSFRGLTTVAVCLALMVGCGKDDGLGRKAISGSVTLDGAPVGNGSISFEPQGSESTISSGGVIQDGKYALEKKNGLPVGKYRVRINIPKPGAEGAEDTATMPGEPERPPADLAPPQWNSKSTQSIEVTADGAQEFNFDVLSK